MPRLSYFGSSMSQPQQTSRGAQEVAVCHVIPPPRGGSAFATMARLGLAAACALSLAGCVTPQERHNMDQGQCYEFGFEPGTDGFAQCMMDLHQQRVADQADRDLYWRKQAAEQSHRREAQHDLYKVMSLQRSGDARFPVCGASSDGGLDRRTMTWYGANCRAR